LRLALERNVVDNRCDVPGVRPPVACRRFRAKLPRMGQRHPSVGSGLGELPGGLKGDAATNFHGVVGESLIEPR